MAASTELGATASAEPSATVSSESRTTASTEPRPVTPVGILAETLSRVRAGLADAGGVDSGLLAELDRAERLAAGLEPYLGHCSTPESPALAALARCTEAIDWEARSGTGAVVPLEREMISGHVEGRFLAMLVRLLGARQVLEVGMFTGYSALAMAEALPADGRLIACELDPEVAAFGQVGFAGSPAGERIEVRIGPAAATLGDLAAAGESFDLVFIDADKDGYLGYVDAVLAGGLLTPGGLICVDNTLLQGEAYLPEWRSGNGAPIAAFNEAIAADPRVEQVLVPLRDGITLIRPLTAEQTAAEGEADATG
jgi:caffeoyl-CoA O-methyltransferase